MFSDVLADLFSDVFSDVRCDLRCQKSEGLPHANLARWVGGLSAIVLTLLLLWFDIVLYDVDIV